METIATKYFIKVNLPGGYVSSGKLLDILKLFQKAEIDDISFGSRQQLIGYLKHNINRDYLLERLEKDLLNASIFYEVNSDSIPNIVSSYCSEDVFVHNSWVSEGIYSDILDQLDFTPSLKINISNADQSFTPFFTGNINFIASPQAEYWYLYVRPKQSNELIYYPALFETQSIGKVIRLIEAFTFSRDSDPSVFIDYMMQQEFVNRLPSSPLELPQFKLPYYEGFNRYGDKTWLGIYRRKEKYKIEFLIDLCELCLVSRVGQICCTPWKSLIIKNIENQYRQKWDDLLGKHGINVRHAANELNWQIEDYTPQTVELKTSIIRQYDDFDIRTFGLCFAIQTRAKSEVFGSIVIKERSKLYGLYKSYDLYHTVDFNPNTRNLVLFEGNVSKQHLAKSLYQITKYFYKQKQTVAILRENKVPYKPLKDKVYQCQSCLTIYDQKYGDAINDIEPGVGFEDLSEDYTCPICESPKINFKLIEAKSTSSI